MDMITDPSLWQKRKVVSNHYHHRRPPLSNEKRMSAHDRLLLLPCSLCCDQLLSVLCLTRVDQTAQILDSIQWNGNADPIKELCDTRRAVLQMYRECLALLGGVVAFAELFQKSTNNGGTNTMPRALVGGEQTHGHM